MNSPQSNSKGSPFPKPAQTFLRQLLNRKAPIPIAFKAAGLKLNDLPGSHCCEIAIVGRSNVGKSSLINFLSGQKTLAHTSRTPGRTQTINLFAVDGGRFLLVDLPGYGYAESNKSVQAEWQAAMSVFLKERQGLFAFLMLIDSRRDIQQEDVDLYHWLLQLGLIPLIIQTKADKIHKSQWAQLRKTHAHALKTAPELIVTTSADKGIGREAVYAGLVGLFGELEAREAEASDDDTD